MSWAWQFVRQTHFSRRSQRGGQRSVEIIFIHRFLFATWNTYACIVLLFAFVTRTRVGVCSSLAVFPLIRCINGAILQSALFELLFFFFLFFFLSFFLFALRTLLHKIISYATRCIPRSIACTWYRHTFVLSVYVSCSLLMINVITHTHVETTREMKLLNHSILRDVVIELNLISSV